MIETSEVSKISEVLYILDYYTFHLQLEFTPAMTSGTGTMKLEASINEKLYATLWDNKTVGMSYAFEDPRIFLIEGE